VELASTPPSRSNDQPDEIVSGLKLGVAALLPDDRGSADLSEQIYQLFRPHLRTSPAEPTEDEFLAALQSTINNHWETSMSTPEIARRIRAALSDAGFTISRVQS
jgi:hypothetical protein